jgi:cellulose biosynthesis protein BcsQ
MSVPFAARTSKGSMTALRTTFYSYKGGVGRTLALLNVAALLAANGRKVVAVDLDLEAPGFGLSSLTRVLRDAQPLGATDLLHDRFHGGAAELRSFCYQPTQLLGEIGENLWLMPSGLQSDWLIPLIPQLYREPRTAADELFNLLYEEIDHTFNPDFILFDSRTGRADIAGVALLQLAQVVFAMCGLNEQNVIGMGQVLKDLREREKPDWPSPLMLLGIGPIPREVDSQNVALTVTPQQEPVLSPRLEVLEPPAATSSGMERLLRKRIDDIKNQLMKPIQDHFARKMTQRFPGVAEEDLLHLFPYDPAVPIGSELIVPVQANREADQFPFSLSLIKAYERLANVVALAGPNGLGLWPRTRPRERNDGNL